MRLALGLGLGHVPLGKANTVPAPTAIPALANLVTRFSADSLSLGNGANVTSWTDSINSIVAANATSGERPTFATNRLNGKPSVQFPGAWPTIKRLMIATPGALATAIDSKDFTVFIVFRTLGGNATSNPQAGLLTTDNAASLYLSADGQNVQWNNVAALTVPYAGQTSFSTIGQTAFNTTPNYSGTGALQSFYVNGGAASSVAVAANATGGQPFTIGSLISNNPSNAEIFDILVWNKPLTPAQYMQAQMWACDKYGQAYPWASVTAINTFFGDSITQGVGASTIAHQAPYLAAQSLGLNFGQWHNIGIGGITVANMGVLAPSWVDPIPALISKKINLVGFEWHNENLTNPTLPLPYNHAVTYLAARKAIANQRTVWGTSTSESADPIANRASYNSAFDAAHANVDSYVPTPTSV